MAGPETTPRRQPRAAHQARQKVGKGPVIGSAIIHTGAIVLVWWTSAAPSQLPDFITFEVEMISPPAAELGDWTTPPPEDLIIDTPLDPVPEPPDPTPTVVDVEAPVAPVEEIPPPEVVPEPDVTVATPDVEPVDDPEPPTSPDPDPDVETPGEDLNVRMEGLRRDYPVYYNNIIRQMRRCLRWQGGQGLVSTVYFVINRDGSVSGVDVLESSRSIAFDIQAMEAAECAGREGRLGPLPEDLSYDQLPVKFEIEVQGRRDFDAEE